MDTTIGIMQGIQQIFSAIILPNVGNENTSTYWRILEVYQKYLQEFSRSMINDSLHECKASGLWFSAYSCDVLESK